LTPTLAPTDTPPICPSAGQVVTGTYPSLIAGPTRYYRIYLPPCYGEDGRTYPTLYLFHGSLQDDSTWDTLGLDEAADEAILAQEIPPLLIVMPDGGWSAQNTSGGPGSFEGVVLNELIPFVQTTYCSWSETAGRAIGGLSRGGYWALEIAFRHPELFVSVGGHSAALLDIAAGPTLNPQQTGLTNDLGDLRIYMDFGRQDYLLPNTLQLHQDMEAAGVPHTWVLQDGNHEEAYWTEHLAEYLVWYTEPWSLDRTAYPPCTLPAPQP
jgi:enterochelin esterase-like enzyme